MVDANHLHVGLMDPVHDSILAPDELAQLRAPELRHDGPRARKLFELVDRSEEPHDDSLPWAIAGIEQTA